MILIFFFQAEDGIRDYDVTGVQTCALPIYSETEILFAYGSASFASKMGELAGNHFLTVVEGNGDLAAFGRKVLWEGAQAIEFSAP